MSGIPSIAIVGRPNVGKSSLMNALVGYRRSIVFETPGTTVDEVGQELFWEQRKFRLLDTQGLEEFQEESLLNSLSEKADAYLFVVDARVGVTPFENELAKALKRKGKPILLLVNKSEGGFSESNHEFAVLGIADMLGISVAERRNLSEISRWCISKFQNVEISASEVVSVLQVALVGRPNTGKSTLMNQLCRSQVSQVSPVPHTTRDFLTYEMETPKGRIRWIDTAGIRKRSRRGELIEIYSTQSAKRAVRSSDVVMVLFDASEPVTEQDMKLISMVAESKKPAVVLFNKWDLLNEKEKKIYLEDLRCRFGKPLSQFEWLPISAQQGFHVSRLLGFAFALHNKAQFRVSTSELNRVVKGWVEQNPPPSVGNRNFNILYTSQVKSRPPTFVFFMNRKAALPESYQRFLRHKLQSHFGLKSQPIQLYFRDSKSAK